jgi:tetratricopeptide (TPR) repeat protein
MKLKHRLFLVVIPIVLLVAFFSYAYIVRRSDFEARVQLYKEGLETVKTKENSFYPRARIAYYDSVLEAHTATGSGEKKVRYFRDECLLEIGKEKDAIQDLETLLKDGSIQKDDPVYTSYEKLLCMAYLRLGERNNCVSNHTAGSCIYPIQGDGVYADPYATQKAANGYEDLLRQDPNNLEARWLLNIAYMTLGRYPAGVPAGMLIPGMDKDSSGVAVTPFKDVALSLGLNGDRTEAGGSIVEDFDNDGNLDIVTSSWDLEQSMHYYHNNGDGTFTDRSKASGLADIKGGLNLLQADFNNDGNMDILVLRGAWMRDLGMQPKTLLRNNGDGTFTDVTVESGLLSFGPTQAATWADFNNDGYVDLFIGQESYYGKTPHPSELWINNHDGTFTNVAAQAGCEQVFFMKGATSGDYNRDGWPDIFISGFDGRKMLLRNKGIPGKIPQFEDVTRAAGLDRHPTYTFPTWFFDYDNDGWPDIFVCGYAFSGGMASTAAAEALGKLPPDASKMYLYHNNHDGTFTEVTDEMGLNKPVFSMGANFGDIDNDGWPDFYLGTGNPDFASLVPNRLFKNMGGKGFKDITVASRTGNLQKGHGVSFADIDNDGDQDIFLRSGGAYEPDGFFNSLYLNEGQDTLNNWISLLLKGTKANRAAIGAFIQVRFTENGVKRTVYMDVNSGGSFGCNPMRKEIGIGRAKVIDELVIRWPGSGTEQVFRNVAPRQFLTIEEGSDQLVKANIKPMKFQLKDKKGMLMKMVDCGPTE